MSVIDFPASSLHEDPSNPLDDMEDLLDGSGYDYSRETSNRLSFLCESKLSRYTIILEWHPEFAAVRCSVIMKDTQKTERHVLDIAIENANAAAWHGFFNTDGVGNTIFKTLVSVKDADTLEAISTIEDKIDNGIEEMDRIYISLGFSNAPSDNADTLFADDDWKVENLALMFSDTKGNA